MPVSEIDALHVLDDIIRVIEKRGNTEMSHRVLNYCTTIFRHAVLTRRIQYNPLADMRGVLKPHRIKSYPTIKIDELAEFIQKLDGHNTSLQNKIAIKLLVLTFVRQGELRKSKWEYFDFDKKLWYIPAELMKMRKEHVVPLAPQTIELLQELKNISGDSEYLFPTRNMIKHPYMNENVINKIIDELGYKGKLVAHGFRSLASTTLNELGFSPDIIEKQLAHSERNKVRAAYNRAEYLPQRIEMMQAWAHLIEKQCRG